jgi:hypothetical protein
MKSTSPEIARLATTVVVPNAEALRSGVPIGARCVVRNPDRTGFGHGVVEAEIIAPHPGDELRLSPANGLVIDGSAITYHGRPAGAIVEASGSDPVLRVELAANVYYDAASAIINAIEFRTEAASDDDARAIELRVTDAERRTARARIELKTPSLADSDSGAAGDDVAARREAPRPRVAVEASPEICVLVARMRSGTTAFRSVLSSHPKIRTLGEVFHNDYLNDRRYFYNFYLHAAQQDPTLCLPSGENRVRVFSDYVSFLKSDLGLTDDGDRVLVMGINYNSLHALNTYWQHPFSPPHIFHVLRRLNISIIHLRRENLLRTLISEHRARRLGIWHRRADGETSPSPEPSPAIELDPRSLLAELEERDLEISFMQKCLSAYPRVLDLTYEQTFQPDNQLSAEVLQQCADFLGVENRFDTYSKFQPTAPPTLREAVSNYDELRKLIDGSRFEHLLDET